MLNVVEIRTSQGALLSLPLDDVSSGLVIQKIEGLDPVKATLVSSSFANMDGAQHHSSRREPRNIKLKLGFEPDYSTSTIQSLRDQLYAFFMPKTQVDLRFKRLNSLDCDIVGRIESFEAPLFTDEPAVDISLMCFDPDFYNPDPVLIENVSTAGSEEVLINYAGTVETGIIFTLLVNDDLSAFTIYFRPPDGTLRTLEFSNVMLADDILEINTNVGSKSVTLTRGSTAISNLYAVSPQSNWMELQPGPNYIRVEAEGAVIPYTIEYITKYGGL
jgi:hypothetical protein